MRTVDDLIRIFHDMDSYQIADHIINDLLGYRRDSRYKTEDRDHIHLAIKAIQHLQHMASKK